MDLVKPCPFCGDKNFIVSGNQATHAANGCFLSSLCYEIFQWNERPKEENKKGDLKSLEKSIQFIRKNGLEIK